MSQPDVTGAGGPAGSPSSRPRRRRCPGAVTRGRCRGGEPEASGAARIRPPADLPARLRRAAIVFPFLILFVVLSVASGPFFTKVNLLDILDQQASTLIIVAAGTLVLVAGGIDLSVGATMARRRRRRQPRAVGPAGGRDPGRAPPSARHRARRTASVAATFFKSTR